MSYIYNVCDVQFLWGLLSSFHHTLKEKCAQTFPISLIITAQTIHHDATNKSSTYTHMYTHSCPSASLDYIIEPWFLGGGATGPGGSEFKEWADDSTSKYGTVFGTAVGDLPDPKQPRCALISGRTADNPRLFKECIDAKCSTIFLEKPGAPTVSF